MDRLLSLQVFCRVVELHSFAACAEQMQISPAMVSKHVQRLEQALNTRLLNRTSRHLSLTEPGQLYYERVRPLLDSLDALDASISNTNEEPRGTLRVSAPIWLACPQFSHFLKIYHQRYPAVKVDVDLNGRQVNLVEEAFDLTLRVSNAPGDNLICRPVAQIPFSLIASRQYVSTNGQPDTLAELAEHPFLEYSLADLSNHLPLKQSSLVLNTILSSNNETLLLEAVRQHMGIALLPATLLAADDPTLVQLLPDQQLMSLQLNALYVSRHYLSAKVRTFIDTLCEQPWFAPLNQHA